MKTNKTRKKGREKERKKIIIHIKQYINNIILKVIILLFIH